MIDDDVIDDEDNVMSPATAARRRVPAYVAAPVVAACALLGYAISLVMPLQSAPAIPTTKPAAAETGHLETSPASPPVESAAAREAPAPVAQSEPITVASPPPTAVPVIRTGSVEQSQAPGVTAASPTAAMPIAAREEPKASAGESGASVKRARELRHKRMRRAYYRRPLPPPPPLGPVEALWSMMTKK